MLLLPAGNEIVREPLRELAQRAALDDRLVDLAGNEAGRLDRVELAELVAVVGQQPFGHELQQDRVVAFERSEDVDVGPELTEAVLAQISGAAACLTALLDRLGRMPRGERLDSGGLRLELALLFLRVLVVAAAEGETEFSDQLLLGEVHGVRLRQGGE